MPRKKKQAAEQPPVDNARIADGAEQFASGATVTFIGDPRGGNDPEAPIYGGKVFPKGKAVDVDAEWLKANNNIRKNNHFAVE